MAKNDFMMAKNDFMTESAENYEQKCLCILVLDVSGSMRGEPIRELNNGLRNFYDEIKNDETTSQRLEVSIITFNKFVKTIQEPALVDNFTMPTLTAEGSTALVDAVYEAIEKVELRKNWYKETGQKYYRPWIILMTDGEPDDGQDVNGLAQRIWEDTNAKRYVFMSVGVTDANMETLKTIQGGEPLKMEGLKFKQFFQWLSASMSTIVTHSEGEKVNISPASYDWMKSFDI